MAVLGQLQARWGDPSHRLPTWAQAAASACASASGAGDAKPVAKRARREMNAVVVFIFGDGWVEGFAVRLMCKC